MLRVGIISSPCIFANICFFLDKFIDIHLLLFLYFPIIARESLMLGHMNLIGVYINDTHIVPEKIQLIDSLLINFSFTLIKVEPERSLDKVRLLNPLTSCPSTPCPSLLPYIKKFYCLQNFF